LRPWQSSKGKDLESLQKCEYYADPAEVYPQTVLVRRRQLRQTSWFYDLMQRFDNVLAFEVFFCPHVENEDQICSAKAGWSSDRQILFCRQT
jgi:hypothetical protein